MSSNSLSHRLVVLLSAVLIVVGLALGAWAFAQLTGGIFDQSAAPAQAGTLPATGDSLDTVASSSTARQAGLTPGEPTIQIDGDPGDAPIIEPPPSQISLIVSTDGPLPTQVNDALAALRLGDGSVVSITHASDASGALRLTWSPEESGAPIYRETFAAAMRFDTIFPEITWDALNASWQGDVTTYTVVAILTDTLPALEQVLGSAGPTVRSFATAADVIAASWTATPTLALLPFDLLAPRLVVLAVDGQNPVENAKKFNADAYPLVASLYAVIDEDAADQQEDIRTVLAGIPQGNRDPNKLTVLAMTGVTAMVRMMADEMDRRGAAWAAEYVGEELSSADITHISNEVPFVEGCVTDTNPENFNFCTKPEYLETLRLSGVDIIGLTGNHQNDYGLKNAIKSLEFYEQEGLPVYGGGRNKQAAFAPLYITHNGNRLAFLGANSYGPPFAFAGDDSPGSAEFDLNIMWATIRAIREKNLADVVLPELQYQESYDVTPLYEQREDFNALIRAGADIVTGVQSHVPQAVEFTDGKLILYGLGNLYFDQMWSQSTRENLVAKHTIYDGRHISTQLLTTLLYDFGQPRWMSPDERQRLLTRVFKASYWE